VDESAFDLFDDRLALVFGGEHECGNPASGEFDGTGLE
jgi:hypothetical protein